jgi:hypothetical protein
VSGRLTARDIRAILAELEVIERHGDHAAIRRESVRVVRDTLLRAALGAVEVESEK